MERTKEKEVLIIVLITIFINCALLVKGQSGLDSCYRNDQNLIGAVIKHNFELSSQVQSIDSGYFHYQRNKDSSYCIASKGEKFNQTDLRNSKLCNARIVVAGKFIKCGTSLHFILYEEEQGGRVGRSCDVYQVIRGRIINLVTVYVPPSVNNFSSLKQAISREHYTTVNSIHFNQ